MAGSIAEYVKSRSIREEDAEVVYKIHGTQDDSEALALLLSEIPVSATSSSGKVLSKREVSLEEDDYQIWTGRCRFSPRNEKLDPDDNPSSYQFETGGGNIHISHSIATLQSVRAGGGTAIDFHNAIGFDGDAINGCDIVSPVFNFSETHSFESDYVDGAYKLALFRATGKTNGSTFKGFAAGEVLFLGASGSKRGDENWEISYRFAASENVTGLSVGGLTGINKRGWDYLWLYFDDDDTQDILVKKPLQANVEQVYLEHDFANIGIGV